jgi:hypothetical protein
MLILVMPFLVMPFTEFLSIASQYVYPVASARGGCRSGALAAHSPWWPRGGASAGHLRGIGGHQRAAAAQTASSPKAAAITGPSQAGRINGRTPGYL